MFLEPAGEYSVLGGGGGGGDAGGGGGAGGGGVRVCVQSRRVHFSLLFPAADLYFRPSPHDPFCCLSGAE